MIATARWRWWAWPGELRRAGVLGINERNLHYVSVENDRRRYPLVDNKILTKKLCEREGIPVPETYAVVECFGDVARLDDILRDRVEFVVKPASGAGGRGVTVVRGRAPDGYLLSGGALMPPAELRYHVSGILSGLYSLAGHPDEAIVEQRVAIHPVFEKLASGGTPDVRVLLYRGVPATCMLRLPTRASGGRANLHQGAVGVGVDIDTGRTVGGVYRNRAAETHPDTGTSLAGLEVPYWKGILAAAERLGRAVGLGYLGIDIVLDAERGPVILEANARPGLAIQIANRRGLEARLASIRVLPPPTVAKPPLPPLAFYSGMP